MIAIIHYLIRFILEKTFATETQRRRVRKSTNDATPAVFRFSIFVKGFFRKYSAIFSESLWLCGPTAVFRFIPFLLLTACVTLPRPGIDFQPGTVVETLSSAVSVSVDTGGGGMAGNGFMVFRRPDQLHLVILSPFGSTFMEAFVQGERITLVYPSSAIAYSGPVTDLPQKNGMLGWSMMRWIMDADPSAAGGVMNGAVDRTGKQGGKEKVTFENGLITAKMSATGDKVYYSKYTVINGAPLATEIDLRNARGDRILLDLSEPEVNTPLDDAALLPRLDGLTVLPLTELKGM